MKTETKIKTYVCILFILFAIDNAIAAPNGATQDTIDTLMIPAADLYQHTWGGENTRLRTDLLDAAQRHTLPLQMQDENAFVFPCSIQTHICSPYGMRSGRMHTGMDLKLSLGDSVVAAWDGVVRMAKKNYYAYGNTVVIRHANGLETLYAHLSKINIQENQPVKAGDLIGYAGRTGRATTEHLHFETRFLYEHFNPNLIIDFTAFSLRSDTLYVRNRTFSNTSLADNLHTITTKDADSLTKDAPLATLSDETVPIQKTTQAPAKNTDTYIVKQGDTLYAISRKMNIRVDELCRLNHIKQESILRIGQKIKLK